MGRKLIAAIIGSFVGAVSVLVLLLLAEETPLLVYTTNRFQIFLMMFFCLSITATISEAVVGTSSWEVIVDVVLIIIASIFLASKFEFAGAKKLFDYLRDFSITIISTAVFSSFFSEIVAQKIRD